MKIQRLANQNEKTIWNYINTHPRVGINKIAIGTKISKPTIIKILKHLKELDLINYPSQQRGKSSLITIKETEFSRIFTKLKNVPKTYVEATVMPLIVQTKNGKTYCGSLDDYGSKTIFLWDSHIFRKGQWSLINNGSAMHELMFELSDIRTVYAVYPENLGLSSVSMSDVMKLWQDQNHTVVIGIDCEWNEGDKFSKPIPHSKDCEFRVHEALSDIYSSVLYRTNLSKDEKEKLENSMEFIIEYIVKKGGKIPWKNY